MKIIRFSRHFVRRWAERKGGLPAIEEINRMLGESVCIVKQERLFRRLEDGRMVEHQELSHYWCHADAVILVVDDLRGRAVTLLTPDMTSKYDERRSAESGACAVL